MTTQTAHRLSILLCALPLLSSCGLFKAKPQPVITRTETVMVPVPAYKPLPHELTAPIPMPPRPLLNCADGKGWPAICVPDALATIPAYQAAIGQCNDDRRRAALFGVTDGQ